MPKRKPAEPPQELITMKEAQAILGVSKPTIYRLIRDGELHRIRRKIGRKIYFDRAELERLKEATTVN